MPDSVKFAPAITLEEIYSLLSDDELPRNEIRRIIDQLSQYVAQRSQSWLNGTSADCGDTLVVEILRGGALMIPAFLKSFDFADHTLVALKRQNEGDVTAEYFSGVAKAHYDSVVFVDCISSSGSTVEAAAELVRKHCTFDVGLLAVISASQVACDRAAAIGLEVVGHSTNETNRDGLLIPDFGRRDAGDIFSGVGV